MSLTGMLRREYNILNQLHQVQLSWLVENTPFFNGDKVAYADTLATRNGILGFCWGQMHDQTLYS